ncbi:hypothetical protein BGZ80_005069 [Entomortierella chlamydospora]|uniref:Uncharacterized protein n=1 Tax=Entomortierella chlamydospora TaxID=101097 RepID=A0A9P6T2C7_9FUNG|nr:hypothetical protein BGZ80_005069 [Entomortierella chlamydospora]
MPEYDYAAAPPSFQAFRPVLIDNAPPDSPLKDNIKIETPSTRKISSNNASSSRTSRGGASGTNQVFTTNSNANALGVGILRNTAGEESDDYEHGLEY